MGDKCCCNCVHDNNNNNKNNNNNMKHMRFAEVLNNMPNYKYIITFLKFSGGSIFNTYIFIVFGAALYLKKK